MTRLLQFIWLLLVAPSVFTTIPRSIGGLLARTSHGAGGITAYYHSDLGGNITAMADGNGLVAKYLYDPFGGNISATGTLAEANKYRFSGKEIHSPTGLYNYGFRDYDPGLQRWLTQDPIGELGGLNLYQPFFNAPTTFGDRNGLDNIYASPENIAALSIQNAPLNGTFTATAVFKKVYTPSIPSYQNPGTFPDYQPASTHYEFTGQYQYSSEFQPADPIGPLFQHIAPEVAKQMAIAEAGGMLFSAAKCFSAAEAGERMVQVTSWAEKGITPDLNPGRWVQLGDATKLNFWKTGLPGPKMFREGEAPFFRLERSRVPFANSITAEVPASSLQWPQGAEFWKGVFGQRQLKP